MKPDFCALATRFAQALDVDDFENAAAILADSCVYTIGQEVLRGARIIASYRDNSKKGRRVIDDINFESEVESTADPMCFILNYQDHLTHAGERFTHRCRQHVRFDNAGMIVEITHEDLPGEPEKLAAFKNRHGIVIE